MVPKWEKNLRLLQKSSQIDFDSIIADIFSGNYKKYDWKKLQGREETYRIRIGKFRIIFTNIEENVRIIGIDSRGDIYKSL